MLVDPTLMMQDIKHADRHISELAELCASIADVKERQIFKAIALYRFTEDFYEAE